MREAEATCRKGCIEPAPCFVLRWRLRVPARHLHRMAATSLAGVTTHCGPASAGRVSPASVKVPFTGVPSAHSVQTDRRARATRRSEARGALALEALFETRLHGLSGTFSGEPSPASRQEPRGG